MSTLTERIGTTEAGIVWEIVDKALKKGYTITVDDGEEAVIECAFGMQAIIDEIGHTEETYLHVYKGGERIGFIWLVHGNGDDVVTDCTDTDEILELCNVE